jgi:hypothetical protein
MPKKQYKEYCEWCEDTCGEDHGCQNRNCPCHTSPKQEEKWDKEKELENISKEMWIEAGYASHKVLREKVRHLIHLSNQKIIEQAIEKIRDVNLITHYTGGSSVEPKDIRVKLKDVITILNSLLK